MTILTAVIILTVAVKAVCFVLSGLGDLVGMGIEHHYDVKTARRQLRTV